MAPSARRSGLPATVALVPPPPMIQPTVIGTGTLLWCQCARDPVTGRRIPHPDCIADFKEVLYDGPASSSKTFSDLVFVRWLMEQYPGVRILGLRRTLVAFRESVQVSWEEHVLGADHAWLEKGGGRGTRTSYTNPDGGGHFAIGGTDDIEKHLSSEWDRVIFFEATQPGMTEYHWSTIGTRMRGVGIPHPHSDYPDGKYVDGRKITEMLDTSDRFGARIVTRDGELIPVPDSRSPETLRRARDIGGRAVDQGCDDHGVPLFWRQRVAECNPSMVEGDQHWLMKRWKSARDISGRPAMVRLFAAHADNPRNTADYLDELRGLPEPFRSVYYEGKWVSVEGKCWPTYSPERHLILGQFKIEPSTGAAHVTISEPSWCVGGRPKVFSVGSVVAGFDWGLAHPGALQVFAVVGSGADRIAFRIAEIVQSQPAAGEEVGSLDWWAQRVLEMVDKYRIQAILCDPSARGIWEHFNLRLGSRAGRDRGGICQAADNTRSSSDWVQGGIDLVRTMFAKDRLFLLADVHDGPRDESLVRRKRPAAWHEEIPGYLMARDKHDPERVLPYPDKDRGMDDACDAARYALMDIFETDRKLRPKPIPSPQTLDDLQEMQDREFQAAKLEAMLRRPRRW